MIGPVFEAFHDHVESLTGVPAVDDVARITSSGELVRANYCILFPPSLPELNDNRYTARQRAVSRARHRFDVRPVATTSAGLLAMVDALLAGIIGARLTVVSRKCDPMSLVEGVEEGKAEYDRTARLFYMDLTFECVSRPV